MPRSPQIVPQPRADYEFRVVGEPLAPLRDFYYALLHLSWPATLATLAAFFLVINALFAFGYVEVGGIAHAHPGSFADAFYFSVQTMATIGYGAMYPETTTANILVVAEAMLGLGMTALATGLVFAKFSRPTARVMFTHQATISPVRGVPTLAFRVGNERSNRIVDTRIRALLYVTERDSDGKPFYRGLDLALTRADGLSLARSWTVQHVIDEHSPLYRHSPESVSVQEAEIQIMVVGLDDVSMQVVHASHTYYAREIVWGARLSDVLSEDARGNLILDLRRFHELEPSEPTDTFPYPCDRIADRTGR